MDDGSASGIERAAQQGADAFQGQQFPDPVPAPIPVPPLIPTGPHVQPGIPHLPENDLSSRPHVMEGAWYVSADRGSWWNGVMWVPGRPPSSSDADGAATTGVPFEPLVVFLIALAIMAAIVFIAWQAFQAMPPMTPGL